MGCKERRGVRILLRSREITETTGAQMQDEGDVRKAHQTVSDTISNLTTGSASLPDFCDANRPDRLLLKMLPSIVLQHSDQYYVRPGMHAGNSKRLRATSCTSVRSCVLVVSRYFRF